MPRSMVGLLGALHGGLVCPHCGERRVISVFSGRHICLSRRCMATLRWSPGRSVELHVAGTKADEVESVARGLAAALAPSVLMTGDTGESALDVEEHWGKSGKAWAFAIGLATIVGGVAAVIALFVH